MKPRSLLGRDGVVSVVGVVGEASDGLVDSVGCAGEGGVNICKSPTVDAGHLQQLMIHGQLGLRCFHIDGVSTIPGTSTIGKFTGTSKVVHKPAEPQGLSA